MKCEIVNIDEHSCRGGLLAISKGVPGVPIWRLENSWWRYLNFVLTYRRRNGCNCLKHNYHYGKTRAVFINRFKKHINIGGKNLVAYAEVNIYIVNSTLVMKFFFIFVTECWNTDHAQHEHWWSSSMSDRIHYIRSLGPVSSKGVSLS